MEEYCSLAKTANYFNCSLKITLARKDTKTLKLKKEEKERRERKRKELDKSIEMQ